MLMHAVALRLSKTIGEIEVIPYQEFLGWVAFFELSKES